MTRVSGPVSTAAASSPTPTTTPGPRGMRRRRCAEQRPLAHLGRRASRRAITRRAPRTGMNKKRPPAVAVWTGDLNLVTRWEPCAPLQASSTRRHAHRGATAEPRLRTLVQGFRIHHEQRRGPRTDDSRARAGRDKASGRLSRRGPRAELAGQHLGARRAPLVVACLGPLAARRRKHSSAMLRAASTATRTESTAPRVAAHLAHLRVHVGGQLLDVAGVGARAARRRSGRRSRRGRGWAVRLVRHGARGL